MEIVPVHSKEGQKVVFFTAGNPEVFRILLSVGRSEEQIYFDAARTFRSTCILADIVLQSSSNFYESPIARRLKKDFEPLFHAGIARFVIREDHGDYYSDRESARDGYPPTSDYKGYFGADGDTLLKELQSIGPAYLRQGKMGGTIDSLWRGGLTQIIPGEEILSAIESETRISVNQRDKLIHKLTELPDVRGNEAFVWDVIEKLTSRIGFPITTRLKLQLREFLLRTYFRAASNLYRPAYVINQPSKFLNDVVSINDSINIYNQEIFYSLCDTMGIKSIIEKMTAKEIINFKEMSEFLIFRNAYFDIVLKAINIQKAKSELLREFHSESQKQRSADKFISSMIDVLSRKQISGDTLMKSSSEILKSSFMDPLEIPFVTLQDAILAKYKERLDGFEKEKVQDRRNNITKISVGVLNMGDQYKVQQAGSVGPNSNASEMTFVQNRQKFINEVDMNYLAIELKQLRESLQSEASTADDYIELGNLANAEKIAQDGDRSKIMSALASVGKWSLDKAEKIGVGLAIAAIKASTGL